MVTRSATGNRLKRSKDAKTWPSGDGSSGAPEKTGAVHSKPNGPKKLDSVNSVYGSSMFNSSPNALMFG